MPFTVNQLAEAAKVGLDFYMKNNPAAQLAAARAIADAINETVRR